MPLAARHRIDPAPALDPLPGLVVRRERNAAVLAALQGRALPELRARLADGHRAYVAWHDDVPAAWGWVATARATIGELDAAFAVPAGERYLWNFVTRPTHRGRGLYPRLLDAIVRAEQRAAARFWIAYAPENHASGAGIRKAGFVDVAELSFDAAGRPALGALRPGGALLAARLLGLPEARGTLAPCWRCVRAGRPTMACATATCRCDYQRPERGCAA